MPNERQRWIPTQDFSTLNARLRRVIEVLDTSDRYAIHNVSTSVDAILTFPRTLYRVDTTTASVTVTLPPVASVVGMRCEAKKLVAANTLTLDGDGALIDGAGTFAWATQYKNIAVVSNGVSWDVV